MIGAAIIESEPGPLVELGRFGRGRELRGEVVAGDDHPVLGHRGPGRSDPDGDPELRPLLGGEQVRQAVVVRPMQVAGRRVEQVEDDAVGVDEPARLGHDVAEDLARLAQDGDPGRDLAQSLLGVRASGERHPRLPQRVDQAGGPDGDGGLVGDRSQQAGIVLAPGVGPSARHR